VPYERYIEDNILRPLGMRHATAWEPVPAHLAADLARSYEHTGDSFEPEPFVFDKLVPDGSISASATDMANFMIAHLNDGRFRGTRILDAPTARLMHEQSFTASPAVSGWAHGFMERTLHGRHVLMHDGSWEAFQSAMLLVPEDDLGVFVAYNGTGGIAAITEVIPAFFDQVLPVPAAPSATPPQAAPLEQQVDGFYRAARSSSSTIEKVLTLVGSSRATVTGDGTLRFGGREWTAIGPGVYREVDGTERLALVAGDDGALTYLATDGPAYEKLSWYETVQVNLVVLALFGVPALTVVIGWPVLALVRRLRRRPAPTPSRWRLARRLAAAGSTVGLCFVVLFVMTLLSDTSEFLYGVPLPFRGLMLLPLAFLGLVIATAVTTVRAVGAEPVGRLALAHQIALGAGMLSLVWFLQQWNLIGWRFG
jgi:Beta-lactamase